MRTLFALSMALALPATAIAQQERYLVLDASPGLEGAKVSAGVSQVYGEVCWDFCFLDPIMGLLNLSGVLFRSWGKSGDDRRSSFLPGQTFAGAEINWMPGLPIVNLSAAYLKRITGNQPGRTTGRLISGSVRVPVWFKP